MPSTPQKHLAIILQKHHILGTIVCAYVVEDTDINGTYRIAENITSLNTISDKLFSSYEREAIKLTQEISEKSIIKFFGKNVSTPQNFFKLLESNKSLTEYIANYIDRRISKCLVKASEAKIPIFSRDKNSANIYSENCFTVEKETASPIYKFELNPVGLKFTIVLEVKKIRLEIVANKSEIITNNPCVIRINKTIYQVDKVEGKNLNPFISKKYVEVPNNSLNKYLETFVFNTIREQQVEASGFNIIEKTKKGKPTLSFDNRLLGGKSLVLSFEYDNKTYQLNSPNKAEVSFDSSDCNIVFTKTTRNSKWENDILQILTSQLGLKKIGDSEFIPSHIDAQNTDNEYEIVEWLNTWSKQFEQNGIQFVQSDKLKQYFLNDFNLKISAKADNDWFDLYGEVDLGDFKIPFVSLRKNILHHIKEYTLPNGQIFVLPELWFSKYRTIFQTSRENGDKLSVSKSLINLLIDNDIDSPSAKEIRDKISNIGEQKISLPKNINAELRNYQRIGFAWLALIGQNHINGCLADDMGLGKTLQTITLLQHLYENAGNFTSLIVVPTSLIGNWNAELEKFAPDLKKIIYTGAQRSKLLEKYYENEVMLTTYGTLRNDIEELRNLQFNYLILDESQTIKNPASKIYRAAILLNAKHYLSLSGTPIENSLIDLWAQLNFLNRGMLGSLRNFRNEFQIPIEKYDDANKKQQLKRLIEPLILRRTKEDVAPDLPPLTEQIIRCEMTEEQNEVYEKEKSSIRHAIMQNIESVGVEKSAIHILSGLTRLRQIANHPALLQEYQDIDSGKFNEITRCLTNIVDEGHKILVFSSFVRHLEQVKSFIEKQNIGFEILTGTSTNRNQIVENFQQDTNKKVFLISLKAGGVGLNLTAADYVFVLDPWWNPAAEIQASARSHRIGQNKNVFVYRFISEHTVEDKILSMQSRKEKLAQLFVEESNPLKFMNKDLIMELLD